ncbi:DUF7289 family protein [Natronosalvus halobius]|uniref:DUF7289 family protein n=1 Tax=Natronosalvus halobius TaxID=2953746 RepID=UPI00209FB765|nr:hypothetical protein [Natronosalvus halobius]USZ70729.1 hypothetical protein NGM15_11515 [Natronosalvus halobius]
MFGRTPSTHDREDRAVSEVLAFILVFTIIIGSVTMVSVFGMQSLTSYQEGEQLRNAERAMDALSDNFNDVVRYDGVTARAGELNLRGGSVSTAHEGTELAIEIERNGSPDAEYDVTTGGLVYEAGSGTDTIAYEGGAIFRGDHTGNVALQEPMLRCQDGSGTAVISLLVIDAEPRTLQSSEINQLRLMESKTTRRTYTGVDEVSITVGDSEYEMAWERTLEERGFGGECTFSGGDGRVTIHVVYADLEY